MSGYDWGWSPYDRAFGRGWPGHRPGGRPGGWGGPEASWGPPPPWVQKFAPPQRGRGYDRGVYGEFYPAYGGYPGDEVRGSLYGGYDRAFQPPARGDYGRGRDYGDFGVGGREEPFLPEFAYQRHPELDRPHRAEREWARGLGAGIGVELDDDEVEDAVRQSLFNDDWIDSDRIEVEVTDQVVTLTGEVDDYMEARYAWDDAWEAHGVRGVINQLTVRAEKASGGSGAAKAATPKKSRPR